MHTNYGVSILPSGQNLQQSNNKSDEVLVETAVNALAKDKSDEVLLDAALNALAKALKAMSFYPREHPVRNESISSVLPLLQQLLQEKELILLWSRDGCAIAGSSAEKNSSLPAKAVAREMLTRKLQRLIILPELSMKDLQAFLALITVDAAEIMSGGGIEKAIASAGIATIGANEVDLDLLRAQVEFIAEPGAEIAGDEETAKDAGTEDEPTEEEKSIEEEIDNPMDIQFSLLGIDILLGMLKAEPREGPFLQLAREVIDAAEELKRQEAFDLLLPVMGALLEIHAAPDRTAAQKEFIRYSLEQISNGTMTAYLLDRIEERAEENEFMIDSLCATIGQSLSFPLVQRLCVAESLSDRKSIAIALTRSGGAAISAIVPMLKDERWYVVRNMVTILGELNSPDSVKALKMTAHHPEAKVRKEVVKSLTKIAPQSGEHTLISMLDDLDRDVVRQAIFSLGALRSKAAVQPLLDIVTAPDAFLKELEVKKLAVSALGRIGDHRSTAAIVAVLTTRGWFAPRRWLELKTAAAAALGQLGDESALLLLKRLADADSLFGEACSDAADNLERVVK
jgi:HEAT repeat protein